MKNLHIQQGGLSGKFNGNACMKILKNEDKFREVLEENTQIFADTLDILQKVVESCLSLDLDPEFESYIELLKESYKKFILYFGLSVTPKFHMIFDHIVPFCKEKQSGLGIFSEQASESIHHDFNESSWKHFKLSINNANYEKELMNSVAHYNAKHLVNLCQDISKILS